MKSQNQKVKVRFFAILRDQTGLEELCLDLPRSARRQELMQRLVYKFPSLEPLLERSFIAINGAYATPDVKLSPGDEVAILPPVSGG